MSIVTLTITDTDIATGSYKCEYAIEESAIDDGKVTAAHFTGSFLMMQVPQQEFRTAAEDFGTKLIEALEETSPLIQSVNKETMVLTLTDKDTTTGRYNATITGTDQRDGSASIRPTAAQITGYYMRSLLNDSVFAQKVWAYAEEVVSKHGSGKIDNQDFGPAMIQNHNSEAAQAAA